MTGDFSKDGIVSTPREGVCSPLEWAGRVRSIRPVDGGGEHGHRPAL